MGDKTGALIAAAITLPLVLFLIWWGFRNFIARLHDVGAAIDDEMGQRPGQIGDATPPPSRRRAKLSYEPEAMDQQEKQNAPTLPGVQSNLDREVPAGQISNIAWVSDAQADPDLIMFATNDVSANDVDRAIQAETLIGKGASVSAEMCPARIWGHDPEHPLKRVPHLFNAGGYYIVSAKAAEILRKFDLGGGALHPVVEGVFQNDQSTRIPGDYYCWVFGNEKEAFAPERTPSKRSFGPGGSRWCMPFVIKDDDITVTTAALRGADVWLDSALFKSIFFSGPLGSALIDAGLGKAFRLKKCRVVG